MKTTASRSANPRGRRLALAVGLLLALLVIAGIRSWSNRGKSPSPQEIQAVVAQQVLEIESRENELMTSVFAKEMLAQQCGAVVEGFWDELKSNADKLAVAATFVTPPLTLPVWEAPVELTGLNLVTRKGNGQGREFNESQWRELIQSAKAAGWVLTQAEFRHNHFAVSANGLPRSSVFYVAAHLTNSASGARLALAGDVVAEWSGSPALPAGGSSPRMQRIDASKLSLTLGNGPVGFEPWFETELAPEPGSHFIDPLIVWDLDRDGQSEILLVAANQLYARQTDGNFKAFTLCRHWPGKVFTAVLADFDGDGPVDLLCARFEGLLLFKGSPEGSFGDPPRTVWKADKRLKYGQFLTCGDVDGDGDLDVWLGQYRVPYEGGQMPTPYFDANDGYSSWLLLNQGGGAFEDATEKSGLAAKRWRRSYSGSFIDLDADTDLDLLLVSDFAGLDAFRNEGHGRFVDATREWFTETRAFGMAHAVGDFDGDSRSDIFMTGMNSPTADRLTSMGLVREGAAGDPQERARMAFGNRLYYGGETRRFSERPAGISIARSGWSWGCSGFDADNDGFLDVYVANGHMTKQWTRDYETEFWLHDIHVASSSLDPFIAAYFGSVLSRTQGRGWSYGGNEKNRLYWNHQGQGFVEVGHALGVALPEDCRNVVSEDFDGDGRMDLAVTTFETWPVVRQKLHVFKNRMALQGSWVGLRLPKQSRHAIVPGTLIKVVTPGRTFVRQMVNGDSYRSQHSAEVHFGLGQAREIEKVMIIFPNGRQAVMERPPLNRWHWVPDPGA